MNAMVYFSVLFTRNLDLEADDGNDGKYGNDVNGGTMGIIVMMWRKLMMEMKRNMIAKITGTTVKSFSKASSFMTRIDTEGTTGEDYL